MSIRKGFTRLVLRTAPRLGGCPVRSAVALAVVLALATGALTEEKAADFAPIRYDDCGTRAFQPHVRSPGTWSFATSEVKAPLPARTVAFDEQAVRVRYDGLAPQARYRLKTAYATETGRPRTQTLTSGQVVIHDNVALPVLTRLETIGKGGGLIIGPTHHVQLDTPMENFWAMVHTITQG